jgi:hypothetical protein
MSEQILIHRKSLSSDVRPALEWLHSLRIDISKSRFAKYVIQLSALENQLPIPTDIANDSYDTAIEISDLVIINLGLSRYTGSNLIPRLRDFVSGPIHSIDENSNKGRSYKARSTGVELLIASHFLLGGFKINLETDTDVEAIDKNVFFHIECKRPAKYDNVEKCVQEAYSQLKKRYNSYTGKQSQRGFAVLSITKFSNPGNIQLAVNSQDEMVIESEKFISKFLEEHRSTFYKNLDDRTMGVLIHFQIAVVIRGQKGVLIHRILSGIYTSLISDIDIKNMHPDRVYFREIIQRLNRIYGK